MPRRAGSNAIGVERTIKALADRLDEEDEALVALVRGLAVAVDADPTNAALWREYRAAVATLAALAAEDVDDETEAFLYAIRTPPLRTEMGHAADSRPAVDRPGHRRGGREAG